MMIDVSLHVRQIVFISVPMLAGVGCIWVSYRNPDGWTRNLRLLGAVLIVYGLVILGETLGLFGGQVITPSG